MRSAASGIYRLFAALARDQSEDLLPDHLLGTNSNPIAIFDLVAKSHPR